MKLSAPCPVVRRRPYWANHGPTNRTSALMYNDAMVQGLSEVPFMQDVKHWGVLTIGAGLGNARFTNRSDDKD